MKSLIWWRKKTTTSVRSVAAQSLAMQSFTESGLMRNYFAEHLINPERWFHRQFRMGTKLFKFIAEAVLFHETFFEQIRNEVGQLGHSTFQKVTATLRMMAYGIPDLVDDNLEMSDIQETKCVKHFSIAMVEVFGSEYLRAPSTQDTAKLLAINAERGFPGILGRTVQ
jgi:hypothetical protein